MGPCQDRVLDDGPGRVVGIHVDDVVKLLVLDAAQHIVGRTPANAHTFPEWLDVVHEHVE